MLRTVCAMPCTRAQIHRTLKGVAVVVPLFCSLAWFVCAFQVFWMTSRSRYELDAAAESLTAGNVNSEFWWINAVNLQTTAKYAPAWAGKHPDDTLAAKSIQEQLPMFYCSGGILLLASLGSLLASMQIKSRMFGFSKGKPYKGAHTSGLTSDMHISAMRLMVEFVLTSLLYAISCACVIVLFFFLVNSYTSAGFDDLQKPPRANVWAAGYGPGTPNFYGCLSSLLMRDAIAGNWDQGEKSSQFSRTNFDRMEFAAWGVEDGCYAQDSIEQHEYLFIDIGLGPHTGSNAVPFEGSKAEGQHQLPEHDAPLEFQLPRSTNVIVVLFFRATLAWAQYFAAPLLLYPCLFPNCPFSTLVVVPQICFLYLAYAV
eukprot:CAMPEP_0119320792 /NCGR_PEP_ID=MMETSP1333-20130426/53442_1 /TAXON_ID=418940 /ORGANISM="Scyphosphaera apsteinii, Strain RCC1455" /LENGTH=369 /DNA_ID=CAMNT_0007327587 /DNA_START=13 /DNA_END=1118 /DNA_ORIENTATION=-